MMTNWPKEEPFDQQVLFYLSRSLKQELHRLARARGLTDSALLRQLVADKLRIERARPAHER